MRKKFLIMSGMLFLTVTAFTAVSMSGTGKMLAAETYSSSVKNEGVSKENEQPGYKGEIISSAISGSEEAIPVEKGEENPAKVSKDFFSGWKEEENPDPKFKGKVYTASISGEETAVLEANESALYSDAETLTYSWSLTPKAAMIQGARATAVSKAKKGNSSCPIDSIYARASIVLKDGTTITKKKTMKNSSSVTVTVYDEDVYAGNISSFKSGHQFKNEGYKTVTKRTKQQK